LFTVSPHVPLSSPVTGSAKPKSDVYAVVMFKTSSYDFFPRGGLCCFNYTPRRRL
jgi:hypothetical protein